MKRNVICIVAAAALAAILTGEAFSQAPAPTAVVRTKLTKEISQKALVERGIDILHVYRDGRADLAVNGEQLAWIESQGALAAVLERGNLAAPAALDENLGQYHTYAEMEAELDALALAYPSRARIDTLGVSVEGRPIRAIKISDNAAVDEDEPEVLIMGCHHAREIMSVEVPLLFARYLLEHYGTDSRVTQLVDTREIWIAPMINVDGHVYVEQNHAGSSSYWWRKNRTLNAGGTYGVDLNRNYGYRWGYDDIGSSPTPSSAVYRGTGPFSEPETQVVRDFCAAREIAMSLSYHSYGELILYPWGYAATNTMEQELFAALGDSLRQGNGYTAGNAASGAIYITNGDSDDWLYGETQIKGPIYAFTVELNTYEEGGFAPPEEPHSADVRYDARIEPALRRARRRSCGRSRPPGSRDERRHDAQSSELRDQLVRPRRAGSESGGVLGARRDQESGRCHRFRRGGRHALGNGRFRPVERALVRRLIQLLFGAGGQSPSHRDHEERLSHVVHADPRVPALVRHRAGLGLCVPRGQRRRGGHMDHDPRQPDDRFESVRKQPRKRNHRRLVGGWVSATFDLRSLMVSETGSVRLRFLYSTDASVNNEGLYVDFVNPVIRVERSAVIASNLAATWYHRWPDETGSFIYYARAFDAEGHASRMSDLAVRQVDDLSGVVPPAYASNLEQNYPNPFNPATTLWFTVGASEAPGTGTAMTSLRLYDAAGRTVAVLGEKRLAAGRYSAVWDGRGTGGRPAASGIYFARLQLGTKVFVQKMVLLK